MHTSHRLSLLGAAVVAAAALALPAQAASPSASDVPAAAAAPGYGPGPGRPGAGGGPRAMMRGGYGGGYGSCGEGYGGGYGGGYGPGSGAMMGGWGGCGMMGGFGGWGGGPGMMGGWGRAALAGLHLDRAQIDRIEAIEKTQADKQWALMTQMHQLMFANMRQWDQATPDIDAVMKSATQMSDLRLQMLRNRLETRAQIDKVLSAQQRKQLQRYRRAW